MITEFNDIPFSLVEEKTRNEEMVSKSILKIAYERLMKYLEKNFWLKETIKGSAKLTVVTENIKQSLHHNYKIPHPKIDVIPNGANTELFRPLNMLNSREQLDIDRNDTVICFEGCFYAWQGLEYLVGTMPIILKKVPNTTFLIVGDEVSTGNGDSKRKLIGMVKELDLEKKVIFTGVVPYEEVPIYLNASDVCVAPFIKKRNIKVGLSPLKIYEYAACGKPIVTSRIPNLEFIEQNNAGILVEPENTKELAKAIIKLLKDKKLRDEMGRNGRDYVAKNHSWESVAKKVAEVCEGVIEERKGRYNEN
jgi:glycosyltransferase involved in cell wall biosynthesis